MKDFCIAIAVFVIIVAVIGMIVTWADNRQRKSARESVGLFPPPEFFKGRMVELRKKLDEADKEAEQGHRLHVLEEQVDHLAKVLLLTLNQLGLEYEVQPETEVLVKKTKERG